MTMRVNQDVIELLNKDKFDLTNQAGNYDNNIKNDE